MRSSKSEKGMENETALEKLGKEVTKNYDNLLQKYQPALKKLINAAGDIEQSMFDLARAQSDHLKALQELQQIGKSGGINEDVDQNLVETTEMFHKVNLELSDFQKVIASDLVLPFESKLPTDLAYLESEVNGFRETWNKSLSDLYNKEKSLAKLQKNRGKSKKDDQKRYALEQEIAERKRQMEGYGQFNLKKSVLEQNRRFAYVAEKHKAHSQKLLMLCEQNMEIIRSHVDQIEVDNLNLEKDAESKAIAMAPRKSIYELASSDIIPPKPSVSPESITNGHERSKSPPAASGKKRVKASHNYGGDGKTKLHIEIGDTIQLLIPQPRDGWHYGENERSGEKGWFPIQYTTKIESSGLRRV